MKRCAERMFRAAEEGDLDKVLKYGQGQFHMKNQTALARDVCGRNVLHRALLTDNEILIISIIEKFPYLVNLGDNVSTILITIIKKKEIEKKIKSFGKSAKNTKEFSLRE